MCWNCIILPSKAHWQTYLLGTGSAEDATPTTHPLWRYDDWSNQCFTWFSAPAQLPMWSTVIVFLRSRLARHATVLSVVAAKTCQLLAILDQQESQSQGCCLQSCCKLWSNYLIQSLSLVCITVSAVQSSCWYNVICMLSGIWICACLATSALCHVLPSLAFCLMTRTAIIHKTRLICPPLRFKIASQFVWQRWPIDMLIVLFERHTGYCGFHEPLTHARKLQRTLQTVWLLKLTSFWCSCLFCFFKLHRLLSPQPVLMLRILGTAHLSGTGTYAWCHVVCLV